MLLLLLACSGDDDDKRGDDDDAVDTDDSDVPAPAVPRLFMSTGEADPARTWHGLLRFDDPRGADLGTEDGFVHPEGLRDDEGTVVSYARALFVDEAADELWISGGFSHVYRHVGECEDIVCGSVAVLRKASKMDGVLPVHRQLFGPKTGLDRPAGIWVEGDTLAVALPRTDSVATWTGLATLGDRKPDWTADVVGAQDVRIVDDVLYVLAADGIHTYEDGVETGVVGEGGYAFAYDAGTWVVTQLTHELLVYEDLTSDPVRIDLLDDGEEPWHFEARDVHAADGRWYVAWGWTPGGTETVPGAPFPGSPSNAVLVLEDGAVTKRWTYAAGGDFFPPQSLWMTQ